MREWWHSGPVPEVQCSWQCRMLVGAGQGPELASQISAFGGNRFQGRNLKLR